MDIHRTRTLSRAGSRFAPHLEMLLSPSQLDLPLDQPVASHLEKLLGPAPSTQAVLNALDRQYRDQGPPGLILAARGAYFPSPR